MRYLGMKWLGLPVTMALFGTLAGCTADNKSAPAPFAPSAPLPTPAASALPVLTRGDMSVRWKVVSSDPKQRVITISYDSGCERNPPIQVAETERTVMVRVVIPSAIDPFFCLGPASTSHITLVAPLGTRQVVAAPVTAGR